MFKFIKSAIMLGLTTTPFEIIKLIFGKELEEIDNADCEEVTEQRD